MAQETNPALLIVDHDEAIANELKAFYEVRFIRFQEMQSFQEAVVRRAREYSRLVVHRGIDNEGPAFLERLSAESKTARAVIISRNLTPASIAVCDRLYQCLENYGGALEIDPEAPAQSAQRLHDLLEKPTSPTSRDAPLALENLYAQLAMALTPLDLWLQIALTDHPHPPLATLTGLMELRKKFLAPLRQLPEELRQKPAWQQVYALLTQEGNALAEVCRTLAEGPLLPATRGRWSECRQIIHTLLHGLNELRNSNR